MLAWSSVFAGLGAVCHRVVGAVDRVATVAAGDPVGAARAAKDVVAAEAEDHVVAAAGIDLVGAVGADEHVVTPRADEREVGALPPKQVGGDAGRWRRRDGARREEHAEERSVAGHTRKTAKQGRSFPAGERGGSGHGPR